MSNLWPTILLALAAFQALAQTSETTTTSTLPPHQHYYDELGREVYSGEGWSATILPQNIATPTARSVSPVIYLDAVTGESIREVTPCQFEINYKLANGDMRQTTVEEGCLIEPSIAVTVSALSGGVLRFSYTLSNKDGAPQVVSALRLIGPFGFTLSGQQGAGGWSMPGGVAGGVVEHADETRFGWVPLGTDTELQAGQTISGMTAEASYLAGITSALVTGIANYRELVLEEELAEPFESAVTALDQRSRVRVGTIGPMRPVPAHTDEERRAAIDWMISDIDHATSAGYVDSATVDQLRSILTGARDNQGSNNYLLQAATDVSNLSGLGGDYRSGLSANLQVLAQ